MSFGNYDQKGFNIHMHHVQYVNVYHNSYNNGPGIAVFQSSLILSNMGSIM